MKENSKVTTCCNSKELEKTSFVEDDCCANTKEILNQVNVIHNERVTEEFRVYGMDCPACAVTIEKSLRTQQSINGVHVNYSTGKVLKLLKVK